MRGGRAVGIAVIAIAGLSAGDAPRHAASADPAAAPVRFIEGTVHGFLELHTATGTLLAHGDLVQRVTDDGIESRMVFHFPTSTFEERVTFTQDSVFRMRDYHLVQRGPAFAEDLDVSLSGSGAYVIRTASHADSSEKRYAGTLELPPDVYNGMVIILAKNLPPGGDRTVHIVAFTPTPRIIELELVAADTGHVLLGTHQETVTHVLVKPELGAILRLFAILKGQSPPNSDAWIVTDEVPAFVRFQGPLDSGPVWRIDLASPTWPR